MSAEDAVTGQSLSGGARIRIEGDAYRCESHPPTAVNLIRVADGWRLFPTDISGGIRGGDRVEISIDVGEETDVAWTPPGSMIVYPARSGESPARSTMSVDVSDGSRFIAFNKAAIPCRGSSLEQRTTIGIASGSGLLWLEVWSSGRVAHEEQWGFACITNRFSCQVGGETVYRERWTLAKDTIPEGGAGFFGFGTMWTALFAPDESDPVWDPRTAISSHLDSLGGISEWASLRTPLYMLKGLTPHGRTELPSLGSVLANRKAS